MQDQITVTPTSRRSAACSDIILRKTQTSRLIFRPMLVDNPGEPKAAIKGGFIYQRKSARGDWEDTQAIELTSLKGGDGIKLPLKSEEVYKLFNELKDLYELFEDDGIPSRRTQYLKVSGPLAELADLDETELREYLNAHDRVGSTILSRLLKWATDTGDAGKLASTLDALGPGSVEKLGSAVNLSRFRAALHVWKAHRTNSDEGFWQSTLKAQSFVLGQVFAYPILILQEKAYVGGKGIENMGGGLVDYLCANAVTQNVALIEIKTPRTRLLAADYRQGIPNVSAELAGSIVQVATYRDELTKRYAELMQNSESRFEVFQPECLVVIGDAATELRTRQQRRSFELFRSGLTGVRVVTYDELFGKVEALIEAMSSD